MPSAEQAKPISRTSPLDIDLRVEPERLQVQISPAIGAVPIPQPSFLWHKVDRSPSVAVTIESVSSEWIVCRLSVRCQDTEWRDRWLRWSYASRLASELQGGDAMDAQDLVSEDGKTLNLLVAPGETRKAYIEFRIELESETRPNDFVYEVVAEDITDRRSAGGAESNTMASLVLRHPPSKLLGMLPVIYAEALDEELSADEAPEFAPFFARYLLGFEDVLRPMQEAIDRLDRLFAPYSTPTEFLLWLAEWVLIALDDNWPEMKRRQVIAEAVELFRWRGTPRGLSRYIEIYTGFQPQIDDQPFCGLRLGPNAKLGSPDAVLGDVPPNAFVVTLAVPDPAAVHEGIVREIIEREKPAHAAYSLRIVRRV